MTDQHHNLFVTGTPYQFISALSIIFAHYASSEYVNEVYIRWTLQKRFNPQTPEIAGNIRFVKVLESDWPTTVKKLKSKTITNFFFYQESEIFNKYLAYHLKRRGAKICLGPDGTKVYAVFQKKHEQLSMLKDTWNDYKLLWTFGFYYLPLFWSTYYRYGSFPLLDEVWVPYVNLFDAKTNRTVGQIRQLPELTSRDLQRIAQLLNIRLHPDYHGARAILYFNQPFWSEQLLNRELELLSELYQQFPDQVLYIKLHPGTTPNAIKNYGTIPNVQIIEDEVPAEFYIAQARNAILITGWSTCLMHHIDKSSACYYLYPAYKSVGDKILDQIQLIPFEHVEMVGQVSQIVFK